MKSNFKVVVIGGGVVGCSILYHLTKFGWPDVCLIERRELTSGSTWHAAGGFHTLNADTNMAALQSYTIELYKEIEEISGQSCGLHHVGGITIATDRDRMDFLKAEHSKHKYMGLKTELIGPEEISKLCPIINGNGIIGALYDPLDGHLDPSGTTYAYAKAAKSNGAKIYLKNMVKDLIMNRDKTWSVITEHGTIQTEHVVNAAGLWAREVGEMVGVNHPLHPMEHQYLISDDIKEVYERKSELPHVMDPSGETYLRQEGRGLVLGAYEQKCEPWAIEGTSWDFGHELLPDNLDRIEDSLSTAFERYPCLERAGIKRIINGPFTFAPDGNPLVGPVPGLQGYWAACAVMAGFSQGGGVGMALAEWMIEGEPSRDIFAMDVSRFGDFCTKKYTRETVIQNYQRRFAISYPNEELPAGRPLHRSPMYNIWKSQNAVFGHTFGMEAVNYFAPKSAVPIENPSFRRSNAFSAVLEECKTVREAVGISEIHNFSKFMVTGPEAENWLNYMMANLVPIVGHIVLSPLLNSKGKLIGDFTVARLSKEKILLNASYAAQAFHMRWFEAHLPHTGVSIENVSDKFVGFQIAGPNARILLERVAEDDVSNSAFPFLHVRHMKIKGIPTTVFRLTYTGSLGYEIYVQPCYQIKLYDELMAAGLDLGIKPFGIRAIMSLRLEKSFGTWSREYKPDYTPGETGLDRFIKFEKAKFIGREAACAERQQSSPRKLVTMVVDAVEADACADEPIWGDKDLLGFVTSGGYAHYCQKSVALGFVPSNLSSNEALTIEILGKKRSAKIVTEPLFDPKGLQMRN